MYNNSQISDSYNWIKAHGSILGTPGPVPDDGKPNKSRVPYRRYQRVGVHRYLFSITNYHTSMTILCMIIGTGVRDGIYACLKHEGPRKDDYLPKMIRVNFLLRDLL